MIAFENVTQMSMKTIPPTSYGLFITFLLHSQVIFVFSSSSTTCLNFYIISIKSEKILYTD